MGRVRVRVGVRVSVRVRVRVVLSMRRVVLVLQEHDDILCVGMVRLPQQHDILLRVPEV